MGIWKRLGRLELFRDVHNEQHYRRDDELREIFRLIDVRKCSGCANYNDASSPADFNRKLHAVNERVLYRGCMGLNGSHGVRGRDLVYSNLVNSGLPDPNCPGYIEYEVGE